MEIKKQFSSDLWLGILDKILTPVISILFALVAGAVLVAAIGNNLGAAYKALFSGAFGSTNSLAETVLAATPLMFTSLAFSVAYRSGMFNIGAEGQFYAGAILGAWAGYAITGLSLIHI